MDLYCAKGSHDFQIAIFLCSCLTCQKQVERAVSKLISVIPIFLDFKGYISVSLNFVSMILCVLIFAPTNNEYIEIDIF